LFLSEATFFSLINEVKKVVTMNILMIALLILNIFAFFITAYDKRLAKLRKTRISEHQLLTISLIGGTFGSLCAMLLFRHKTSKTPFILKFIFIIVLQALIVYVFFKRINLGQ
jgi:uncharacterized membrane protein YsdA (DUF1294 family)